MLSKIRETDFALSVRVIGAIHHTFDDMDDARSASGNRQALIARPAASAKIQQQTAGETEDRCVTCDNQPIHL